MKGCILSQYLKDAASSYIRIFLGTLFTDQLKPEDQKKYIGQVLPGAIYHSIIPLAIAENVCL